MTLFTLAASALRRIALLTITLAIALGIASSGGAAAADSPPVAIADAAWVAVARSEEGVQYVDPTSIESTAAGVRLKSYWQPATDKAQYKPVYYVTEYDCQGRYRDVEVTNRATDMSWQPIGADRLNRGAMNYGCARREGK